MTAPLNVAVAGLGTVGAETVRLIQTQAEMLAGRCGRSLTVTAVSARTRQRDRGLDLAGVTWFDDAATMAAEAKADVIVEAIGGSEGIARSVCETALSRGRHVVTANKALLAVHGTTLARLAESKGVSLAFEASVAGGIPVIKALREGLAANRVTEIHGILNGTCNYILTQMRTTGRPFADVLADAQRLGYAEADPAFDIDGIDAAHKLTVLAAVAFGCPVQFVSANVEGIRHVSADDMRFANILGYRIKLLGITRCVGGQLEQRVHPCLVPNASTIAGVEDVFNAVVIEGNAVQRVTLIGRGAGAGPTASAVIADLVDIANGRQTPAFGVPTALLSPLAPAPLSAREGAYYLRLMVRDEVGVLAAVARILSESGVSIAKCFQDERAPGEKVPLVLTTHDTPEARMNAALATIAALPAVLEPPRMIRIEQF